MDVIIDLLISGFNLLFDNTLFDIPYGVWFLIPTLIIIAIKFIKGKK